MKTTAATVLLLASAASAGEPRFLTNVSLQVGEQVGANAHYVGRVGGEHSGCISGRRVRIFLEGAPIALGLSTGDGSYDSFATAPAIGDRVEVLVDPEDGAPACRAARARLRHSGM
jgi:hypothetical protein